MKEYVRNALPKLGAGLGCLIFGGIIASFFSEQIGYSFLFAYLYGLFGNSIVMNFIDKRIKDE